MNNYKSKKALVLGIDDRSALNVIRSLGRLGVQVHQGSDNTSSICRFSKYTRQEIIFPNAADNEDLWIAKLEEILKKEKYDLVIPTADNYLIPIIKNRKIFEKYSKLAIPDDRGFLYSYDKSKTFELAEQLGIPCPFSRKIEKISELKEFEPELTFPIIVKPVSSKVWHNNKKYSLKVEYAENLKQLNEILNKVVKITPVLVQSFHSGVGVGQELLLNKGKIIAAFQHERIHEPLKGGGSSYRKSIELNQNLLSYSERILKKLQWNGVAMVEYKYNKKEDSYVLMEINGRFWGSLPLAIHAGVDFPALLFKMMVNGSSTPQTKYNVNTYCRNLTRDLDWFKENIRSGNKKTYVDEYPLYKLFFEIKNVLLLREHFDTIVIDDPIPGIKQLFKYFGAQFGNLIDKVLFNLQKAHFYYNPFKTRSAKKSIFKILQKNPSLLFVCKGNICRSPFAELYLKQKLKQDTTDNFTVLSTGFIEKENRVSPDYAIQAASTFGVNMTNHRSNVLKKEQLDAMGVVFVMDLELYNKFVLLYPEHKNKIYLLGIFSKSMKKGDIDDPYSKNIDYFKHIYKKIIDAIDTLTLRIVK